jgi:hypothetical protein
VRKKQKLCTTIDKKGKKNLNLDSEKLELGRRVFFFFFSLWGTKIFLQQLEFQNFLFPQKISLGDKNSLFHEFNNKKHFYNNPKNFECQKILVTENICVEQLTKMVKRI